MADGPPRKHAQGGYCIQDRPFDYRYTSTFCALDGMQCPTKPAFYEFRTPKEAMLLNWSCFLRSNTEDIKIGLCDNDRCAVDEGSCDGDYARLLEDDSFQDRCAISHAIFGDCSGRCVWSASDCKSFETYNLPRTPSISENYTPKPSDCRCDKVKIGGCKNDGSPAICSVAETACEYTQTWMTHEEVLIQDGFACYLCREENNPLYTSPPTSKPTLKPNPKPVTSPAQRPTPVAPTPTFPSIMEQAESPDKNTEKGDPNLGAIIGGTVGGVVAITLIVGIILFRIKRRKDAAPPPSDVFF